MQLIHLGRTRMGRTVVLNTGRYDQPLSAERVRAVMLADHFDSMVMTAGQTVPVLAHVHRAAEDQEQIVTELKKRTDWFRPTGRIRHDLVLTTNLDTRKVSGCEHTQVGVEATGQIESLFFLNASGRRLRFAVPRGKEWYETDGIPSLSNRTPYGILSVFSQLLHGVDFCRDEHPSVVVVLDAPERITAPLQLGTSTIDFLPGPLGAKVAELQELPLGPGLRCAAQCMSDREFPVFVTHVPS